MPSVDKYDTQSAIELLRQSIDYRGWQVLPCRAALHAAVGLGHQTASGRARLESDTAQLPDALLRHAPLVAAGTTSRRSFSRK